MVRKLPLFLGLAVVPWLVAPAAAQVAAPADWRGFYVGLHGGGGLALVDVADPYGPSIFGDTVRTPGFLLGGQLGYNWQVQSMVFGIEADMAFADMDGTNTCFAASGHFISSNCSTNINMLGTLAARLGWVLPFDGATLIYGKGGLATAHLEMSAVPGGDGGLPGVSTSDWRWGWMLGAGIERAVAPGWSLTAEYNFLRFGDAGFDTPVSDLQTFVSISPHTMTHVPSRPTEVSQDIHLFKLGLNYRFGATGADIASPPPATPQIADTSFEAGARYARGWSQFHKDLGRGSQILSPASRLTYESPSIDAIEAFARLDSSFGLMVKGLLGGGSGDGGQMNDEDWGLPFAAFIPYSNTVSSVDNQVSYWVLDAGYNVWRSAGVTVTPFVGYTGLIQNMSAYGCVQIANALSDCSPALPASTLGITEDDTWQALRLGVAFDMALAPRVKLSAEAAYLPYVTFSGTDNHALRSLVSPESGTGTGVQLEAMLSYALSDAWTAGIGGRYWSMWTTSGDVNFGGQGEFVPMRYAVEQAQVLFQVSYKPGAAPRP